MVKTLEKPTSASQEAPSLSAERTQDLGSWFVDICESPYAQNLPEKPRPQYGPVEDPRQWILFKDNE